MCSLQQPVQAARRELAAASLRRFFGSLYFYRAKHIWVYFLQRRVCWKKAEITRDHTLLERMLLAVVGMVLAASATRLPPSLRLPRCAPVICQQPTEEAKPSPPVALRCLDRQEVLDKLNAVPAFGIVNDAQQLVAEPDEEGNPSTCRFYLDIVEAKAALTALRAANPRVAIDLTVASLGTAFALSEWQEAVDEEGSDGLLPDGDEDDWDDLLDDDDDDDDDLEEDDDLDDDTLYGLNEDSPPRRAAQRAAATRAPAVQRTLTELEQLTVRLQAAQEEVDAASEVLDQSPAPPLLRRRNAREGPIPLFGSPALRFRMGASGDEGGFESGDDALAVASAEQLLTPCFFRRADFADAWAASGGSVETIPSVQVTDLRTLAYQMQYDTTQDYRSLLLVAPVRARTIPHVRHVRIVTVVTVSSTHPLGACCFCSCLRRSPRSSLFASSRRRRSVPHPQQSSSQRPTCRASSLAVVVPIGPSTMGGDRKRKTLSVRSASELHKHTPAPRHRTHNVGESTHREGIIIVVSEEDCNEEPRNSKKNRIYISYYSTVINP